MDDTRYLLPSEIARLVYGYLKLKRCDDVAEKFLNTSPHMKECLEMRNKRCSFMTKAHSLTLEEITDQYLRMNKMLLKAVNEKSNNPKKFYDSVEALKFIIDPNASNENSYLVTEEPVNIDDEAVNDIWLNVTSSPEPKSNLDANITENLEFRICTASKNPDETENGFLSNNDDSRPSRNIDQNAVLNKSGKVKVLRPRIAQPFAGKTITRRADPGKVDSAPNFPAPEDLSSNFNQRLSNSPSKDEVHAPITFNDITAFESPSKSVANDNVLTMQLRSQSAKGSEDSSASSQRSRRSLKKNSDSWNIEQAASNKSSNNKTVPEIEVDPLLIQQTLINNSKLHECIAQNINKAFSESPQKNMISDLTDELNTTVKKVTDATMNNPLCDKIIDEILGCFPNTNVSFEPETDDMDGSNLSFPGKFYENSEENNSPFQSNESAGTNLPTNETNSNYPNFQEYMSTNNAQPETEIIFVGMHENGTGNENVEAVQPTFSTENPENIGLNSNEDIRSYFTNTPDIKEGSDNVETINGSVINVLETNGQNLISVHGFEAGNQFYIARTTGVPLLIGNEGSTLTTVAPSTSLNSKKRNARIQPSPFPTTRVSRRLAPIAPKPSTDTIQNVEVQSNQNSTKNIQPKNRLPKKMKK